MAHLDALRLLAAFMQHGDNKPSQQRLVCLDGKSGPVEAAKGGHDSREADERRLGVRELCVKPFMLVSDLGLTFGGVDILNRNAQGSVNLARWAEAPIWKPKENRCVARLSQSLSGSLHNPVISEAGRKFLLDSLAQLSDAQLNDLFETARLRNVPGNHRQGQPGTPDWVAVFKKKRDEIASRRCEDTR